MDLAKLRELIASNRFEWRKHTLLRLAVRNIAQRVIIEAITKGDVIEDYPRDRLFPSCLILAWVGGKPYHVVVSLDEGNEIAYIITAYEPTLDKFLPDYRTRR